MTKIFAAVNPLGKINFESISQQEDGVMIESAEIRYGGSRVLPINMRPFKGDVSALAQRASLWTDHAVAWVWRNGDDSYWMDTLSLNEPDAVAWASNRSRSEAMGMKVIPVQLTCKMTALQKVANVRKQISDAKERGDIIAEAAWTNRAEELA